VQSVDYTVANLIRLGSMKIGCETAEDQVEVMEICGSVKRAGLATLAAALVIDASGH
jgi:hypothetical protein